MKSECPGIIAVGQEPPPLTSMPEKPAERPATQRHERSILRNAPRPQRKGSRFAVLNAFVDFTMKELPRAEAMIWLALFRDTKADGIAKTSQADLARRSGADIRTVKRAVAALIERGLLVVTIRGSIRDGPSSYRIRPFPPDSG